MLHLMLHLDRVLLAVALRLHGRMVYGVTARPCVSCGMARHTLVACGVAQHALVACGVARHARVARGVVPFRTCGDPVAATQKERQIEERAERRERGGAQGRAQSQPRSARSWHKRSQVGGGGMTNAPPLYRERAEQTRAGRHAHQQKVWYERQAPISQKWGRKGKVGNV